MLTEPSVMLTEPSVMLTEPSVMLTEPSVMLSLSKHGHGNQEGKARRSYAHPSTGSG